MIYQTERTLGSGRNNVLAWYKWSENTSMLYGFLLHPISGIEMQIFIECSSFVPKNISGGKL